MANSSYYPPIPANKNFADFVPNMTGIPLLSKNESVQPWKGAIQHSKVALNAHTDALIAAGTCGGPVATNPGTFWYEQITHNGISPFINDGASWPVFRNVKTNYGAAGDGTTDDSGAIQNAILAGIDGITRDQNKLGTTGQPAVVYIPSGVYVLSKPLQLYVGTVLMGDPLNPPTFKAAAGFNGNTMIYGKDPNQQSATTVFYVAVKNLVFDSTNIDKDTTFTIIDWSVSQATQLTNCVFNMPSYSSGHTGISMPEGGSGTYLGDLQINGGVVGIDMSNQQYMIKGVTFQFCTTAIKLSHCFDCIIQDCTFQDHSVAIDMTSNSVGSLVILDSSAQDVGTMVATVITGNGGSSLILENVQNNGAGSAQTVMASGNSSPILSGNVADTWVMGNTYTSGGPSTGSYAGGATFTTARSSNLLQNGKYFTISPPTYQQYALDQFINIKSVDGFPVYGDGVTDDTANINSIISTYAGCKIIFFPQGTYLVTNTIFVPAGSRLVGEAWSAISAVGSNFYNPTSPVPMVKVGNPGDIGVAQISDILFTVADVLQGCQLLEINLAASNPGDVGLWNSHFRVGGAAGSKVETNCAGSPADCKAAFGLIHLTATSSAYIEDMWGWTADHDLDGGNGQNIATGRGILIESSSASNGGRGTWLVGTAFEHNTLYQYNFHNAKDVYAGMQQSETPYWQGPGFASDVLDPAPWAPALVTPYGDPDYSNCGGADAQCRMAWFEYISSSTNLFLYASGFWTFFNGNDLTNCNNDAACQTNAIDIKDSSGVYMYGVNTKSSLNMVTGDNGLLVTMNNNPGGWGGVVAAMLAED
ncbi:glycoside hydrolase family 55 protein [Hyaloscypha variabilis F]|uniref:Glycoside hydrolase family 55 protein n=1 Tax=Hyaloscypha variabilis (strain UAMH 11265 / GT02V1 / F) TaxID=1149755 RepID=A0A2J6SBN1_HYAVF|nr:glycoside hydrolase family 55 protein [Hyaloscypha variabilis F]